VTRWWLRTTGARPLLAIPMAAFKGARGVLVVAFGPVADVMPMSTAFGTNPRQVDPSLKAITRVRVWIP